MSRRSVGAISRAYELAVSSIRASSHCGSGSHAANGSGVMGVDETSMTSAAGRLFP